LLLLQFCFHISLLSQLVRLLYSHWC
jgi:hypothetical protein